MENRKILAEQVITLVIILSAASLRIAPHVANVAPIGAIALFGGIFLNKRYALFIPLLAMFASDIVIGFHRGMLFVYASFFLIGAGGLLLRATKKPTARLLIIASLASSFGFFVITNFGVWLFSGMYEVSLDGFVSCYIAALPFFRNTILGDLLYFGVFVVVYKIVSSFIFEKYVNLYKKG